MPREEMPFHPAANIFPLDDESIGSLADDIRKHGQQVPIEMFGGQVLDGRRRWLACSIAQIKPATREVKPADPVAYVLSLNLHRRHMNASQLAMVAARARELYDQKAKERMKAGGKHGGDKRSGKGPENLPDPSDARDAAGKAVGVSGRSVDFATKVIKQGTPELVKAVDSSVMAVSSAAMISQEPPEVQRQMVDEQMSRGRRYDNFAKRRSTEKADAETEPPEGESRGVGVQRANEAVNCLSRIPKNDRLRKRGFQIVTDWIRHNK